MPKYRKRPVVIEAMQFTGDNWVDLYAFTLDYEDEDGKRAVFGPKRGVIPTREGKHEVSISDWVIKGIEGEFYPCKPSIFEATYEAVEEDEPRKKMVYLWSSKLMGKLYHIARDHNNIICGYGVALCNGSLGGAPNYSERLEDVPSWRTPCTRCYERKTLLEQRGQWE